MSLKFKIESLDGLAPEIAGMYEQTADGYQLAIEGLPKSEDITGLKSKVDELLREKKEEASRRKQAEDEAEAAKQKAAEEAARKSGDVAALEKSWLEKLSKREKELLTQIDGLTGNINNMLVDNVAATLASEIGLDGSAQILVPHIKSRLAAEQRDGKFVTVVRDANGALSAASLDDLKAEFASNAVFAPVLKGSKASGGGATGGSRNTSGAGVNAVKRADFEAMDGATRHKHITSGGTVID